MEFLSRGLALAAVLFVAVACAVHPAGRVVTPAEAEAAYVSLRDGGKFDLSLVRVVRLDVDGQRIDVASLTPTVLAESGSGPRAARTVFGFSPEKDKVILLTRAAEDGEARLLELSWEEIREGDAFLFPIFDGGDIVEARIQVVSKVQRPEAD